MKLYCGIDLHSNNHVLTVINESDKILYEHRLPNEIGKTLQALSPYKNMLAGIAVESTFNWYWLVDGLEDAGYPVRLVNTSAVKQYEGLKHTDDIYDAFFLAHLMRLGILPTGYIYPKDQRPIRDLMRRRVKLVQCRTAHVLSVQNQHWRSTGNKLTSESIKHLREDWMMGINEPNLLLAMSSNLEVIRILNGQITLIEKTVLAQAKLREEFRLLLTVTGIGRILALTIMLETGSIERFASVGNFASYCRCVGSKKTSNGKKKGEGNRKNGNKYLAWAFVEAANFSIRFSPAANKFFQKKLAKQNRVLAVKALANKLARACYYIMRDQVSFKPDMLFS